MRPALLFAAILALGCVHPAMDTRLLTRAETSGFLETSRLEDIRQNLRALQAHPWVHVFTFGRSHEGRDLLAFVVSASGAFDPQRARALGKPIVLILATIHGGEVCGKEASIMLARELAGGGLAHLARDLTLLFVPVFNVDGNERIDPRNRRLDLERLEGQMGPERGVGIRTTSQGYDLNREYINQEAVEMRHLTRLYLDWWPHLTIDLHTTNGSRHGYHLTYAAPQNTAGHPEPIRYVRDVLLPHISRRLQERTGLRTFFYGNFRNNDPTQGWETYPALPRFGSHYRGLTGRMDILSEAYSYIPFRERVRATYEFVREVLEYVREHAHEIMEICERAEADTIAGRPEEVPVQVELTAWPDPVTILGDQEGIAFTIPHYARFVPVRTVRRPWAYAVDPRARAAIEALQRHGIRLARLRQPVTLEVEEYIVEQIERLMRPAYVNPNQNEETRLTVSRRAVLAALPEGTTIVRLDQPLGTLALYLLEPESEDGLTAWNFLDDLLERGRPFPIRRILTPAELPWDR